MSNWQCKMGFDITTSLRSGELDAPHIVYLNITCGQVWCLENALAAKISEM